MEAVIVAGFRGPNDADRATWLLLGPVEVGLVLLDVMRT